MFLIVSHARFELDGTPTHGTGSELTTFFQRKKKSYVFIWHSLFHGFSTQVETYQRGSLRRRFIGFKNAPFLIRILQEQLTNFFYIFYYGAQIKVFIGIDPPNALSGIIAKKFGLIKKVVFYTADYALKRFNSSVLNKIYHAIDAYAAKNSDEVWNVSSRITELRIEQGVPGNKNFFIPNTPEFSKIPRLPKDEINKHDLVIVSNITKAINYPRIIKATKNLSKKFSDIRLLIIGTGDYQKDLEKFVKRSNLSKRVAFLGRRKHDEVLKILSSCGIGIAIYTREYPWTEYGDSMKAREYLACGLPVIISDVVSTSDDIKNYHAGFVLEKDAGNFEEVVDKIFSKNKLYESLRENAISLARKYDFTLLMEKRLGRFI